MNYNDFFDTWPKCLFWLIVNFVGFCYIILILYLDALLLMGVL